MVAQRWRSYSINRTVSFFFFLKNAMVSSWKKPQKPRSKNYPYTRSQARAAMRSSHSTKRSVSTQSRTPYISQIKKIDEDPSDMQTRYAKFLLHPYKSLPKANLGSPYSFVTFCESIMQSEEGKQAVTVPFSMYSLNHFTDAPSVNSKFTWPNNVFDLDPNRKTTGGENSVIPAGTSSERVGQYLKTCTITGNYVNFCSIPVNVEIMWCLCVSNTTKDPLEEWRYQLEYQRLGQSVAIQANQYGSVNPTVGAPDVIHAHQRPTAVTQWNKFWKVVHRDRMDFAGGAQKVVKYTIGINKYVEKAKMLSLRKSGAEPVDNNPLLKGIAGVTLMPLVFVRGHAVLTNAAIDYVTYGIAKMGMLWSMKYDNVPVTFENKFDFDRVYPTVITGAGFFEEKMIDITGEDQVNKVVT